MSKLTQRPYFHRHRKKAFVVFLVTASIIRAAPAPAVEVSEAQVLFWSAQVNTREFADVLAEVQRGPKEDWPAVASAEYASPLPPGTKEKFASLRDIASSWAHKLEAYHKATAGVSDAEFVTRAAGLLALRDHIARQPSYINWVLVDALNRVLIVNVAKRLVRVQLAPEIAALVEPLASFRLDMHVFAAIVEAELGVRILDDVQRASTDDLVIFNAVSAKLFSGPPLPTEEIVEHAGAYKLLASRCLPALLLDCVRSDDYLHAGLPRTLQYLRKAGPFKEPGEFRKLSHEDFRKILDAMQGVPTEPVLVERIAHFEIGFHSVEQVLGDVTDGIIDEMLMF